MNFQRGKFRDEPEINLIPMIDVLLVVLIFLMISTTYSKFADLKITLPEAEAEQSKVIPNVLDVAVDADGNYVIDRKEPLVVISADARATHQSVINILSAAQLAGFPQISFSAEAKQK